MSAKKKAEAPKKKLTPVQQQQEQHGGKEKLVDKLVSLLGSIQKSDEDKDTIKTRLLAASNKKLLRLLEVGNSIKDKFGSIEKLAEETARAAGRAKDAPYIAKLKTFAPARLLDLFRVSSKSKGQKAA
jgi:hypothetical protein